MSLLSVTTSFSAVAKTFCREVYLVAMTKLERNSRMRREKGTKKTIRTMRMMRTGLASVRRLRLTSSNCVSTIINGTQKERSCWRRLRWWCWDESTQNSTFTNFNYDDISLNWIKMMITQDLIIDDDKYNALKMHIKQMLRDTKLLETSLDNKTEKKTVRKIVTIINAELSHLLIEES